MNRGSISQKDKRFFSFIKSRPTLKPTQPPFRSVLGAIYQRVNKPGHETNNSSPSNAAAKNERSYISTASNAYSVIFMIFATTSFCLINLLVVLMAISVFALNHNLKFYVFITQNYPKFPATFLCCVIKQSVSHLLTFSSLQRCT